MASLEKNDGEALSSSDTSGPMMPNSSKRTRKLDFTELVAEMGPWNLEAESIDLDTQYVKGYIACAYAPYVFSEKSNQTPAVRSLAPGDKYELRLGHIIKAWTHYSTEILLDTPAIQEKFISMVKSLCECLVKVDGGEMPEFSIPFYGLNRTPPIPLNLTAPVSGGFGLRPRDPHYYYWRVGDAVLWYPVRLIERPLFPFGTVQDPFKFLGIRC